MGVEKPGGGGPVRGCVDAAYIVATGVIGAGIGGALLGLSFRSLGMAAVGACVGAIAGLLFGRYIKLSDVLLHWFD